MNGDANGNAIGEPRSAPDFHRSVDPAPDSLVDARVAIAEWASAAGVPEDLRVDLVLATYEALANAAEHGYRGRTGVIELHACRTGDVVVVTVEDRGVWRPPPDDKGSRGRGLVLMAGLAESCTVTPAGSGTTVVMRWSVPPA